MSGVEGPNGELLDRELDELDLVVERLWAGLDGPGAGVPGASVDTSEVAGFSGQAQENRAIHRSKAQAARERARATRERAQAVREQAQSARDPLAELARRVRDGSRLVGDPLHQYPDTDGPGPGAWALSAEQLSTAMDAVAGSDLDAVVSSVAGAVVGFAGVSHATVCLRDSDGVPRHWAGSDTVGNALAEIQARMAQGPCVDAARTGRAVRVQDVVSMGAPWPMFGAVAVGLGVTGVVAVPLRTRGPVGADLDAGTGSLTLWTRRAEAVTDSLVALAEMFARYAGLAITVAQWRSRRVGAAAVTTPTSPG